MFFTVGNTLLQTKNRQFDEMLSVLYLNNYTDSEKCNIPTSNMKMTNIIVKEIIENPHFFLLMIFSIFMFLYKQQILSNMR